MFLNTKWDTYLKTRRKSKKQKRSSGGLAGAVLRRSSFVSGWTWPGSLVGFRLLNCCGVPLDLSVAVGQNEVWAQRGIHMQALEGSHTPKLLPQLALLGPEN